MSRLIFRIFSVVLGFSVFLFLNSLVFAEEPPRTQIQAQAPTSQIPASQINICNVMLRVLGADDYHAVKETRPALSLDPELVDIQSQLDSAHYSVFKLLEQQVQQLRVRQPGEFSFTTYNDERHTLQVLPVNASRFNIKLVLGWLAPGGETVVATQLRVPTGKSIVIGADDKEQKATVLAVKVECFS